MVNYFITVFLAILPFSQCIQIHKHMTEEEVLKTFQTGHDSVPEYEVVRLYHTLHKRDIEANSTQRVKVNAFGRQMSLYLYPTDGLLAGVSTPVWTVVSDAGWPERTKYTLQPHVLANIGRAYQDASKMAAIVAYDGEDGQTLVQGNLLDDIVIRPLPHHLHDTVLRETRSFEESSPIEVDDAEYFQRSHHHVVFRRPQRDLNPSRDSIRVVKREKRNVYESVANGRSRRSIPDIIYPEILIIVDYSLYIAIGTSVEEVARYVLAFWNAVDLRYRLLEEPVIRLNIAGIIISVESGGTPYLEDFKRGSSDLDADLAIVAMSTYFYRESYRFRFTTYDMAVAMTHLDMCNMGYNGICDRSTLGYAYEWGACNRSHVDMNTEAVGIVEDNGGYSAIIPAAHEVAHLMGAPHDGLPETLECSAFDKFIMSSALHQTENSFQWSNCSLKFFHDFFSSPDSTCVYNKPKIDKPIVRLLPGKFLTLDEQCEKSHGTRACPNRSDPCVRLSCWVPEINSCNSVSSAAEGSPCGEEKHCINGHCVSKHARFVPVTLSTTMKPKTLKPWNSWFFPKKPHFIFPTQSNVTDIASPESKNEKENNFSTKTNDR